MSKAQLIHETAILTVAAFLVALLFGGCTNAQLEATNKRLIAAEAVAYTACVARQKAPIVAQALRDTVEDMVPGGSVARGVVAGSCELILANPGTTITFMTKDQQ